MNRWLDGALVGLVLLAGFGYAAYSLGPKALRVRMLAGLAWLARPLPASGLRQALQRRSTTSSACGGCDNCGSAAASSQDATGSRATPPASASPPTEITIALHRIGKRR